MAITWSKSPFMEKINLNGTEAFFADAEAREHIEALESAHIYLGVSATELTDGATTNPIMVYKSGSSGDTKEVTAISGNIVSYNKTVGSTTKQLEFIWNGSSWCEFGSTGALKAFAFVDQGTATMTPEGSVCFTNAQLDLCVGALDLSGSATGNYTPAGTITNGEVVAAGSVDVSTVKATGTVSLTCVKPTGTVDVASVKAVGSVDVASVKAVGCVDVASVKATGTVSAPEVTLGCTTDTVTTHTFAFCGCTHVLSITDNTTQTLVSAVCVSCVAAPTFCGTGMEGAASFCGTGMEGAATFCGTGMEGTASFCGTALTGDAGFCGTGMEGTATFTGSCTTVTGMGFCGTAASLCLGVTGCTAATELKAAKFANVSGVTFVGCSSTFDVNPKTAS